MATQIFVNLPVKDLQRSKEFWNKVGYSFNEMFSDDKAACMVISDTIFVMLHTEDYFKTFTKKAIADAGKTKEVLIALSAESKEKVDELVDKAMNAGGTVAMEPQTYDFMYYRTFEDLDGHHWEVTWMNPDAMPQ